MPTTIAEQSTVVAAAAAERLPAEVLETFGAELSALNAAGIPAGIATVGNPLPDGALLDAHGAPTTLAAARDGRPAVIVLYRGEWCPYCNIALRTYQRDLLPALRERGIALIAISPQTPDGALTMQEKNDLEFPILSDPGNQIAAGLGVLIHPSDAAVAAQAKLGLIAAEANADGTTGIPMPTVVIAGADGTIGWIDVHPDYTTRSEVADILAAL